MSVYSLACKRVLTCTTVVMETIPQFYYMRACPIFDLYLVVTRKQALSEFPTMASNFRHLAGCEDGTGTFCC